MAKDCKPINPLKRDGTSQRQRYLKDLDPGSVRLMDLGPEEWLRFAWEYAGHLKFFSLQDDKTPEGDWKAFLESVRDKDLSEIEASSSNEPHIALFLSFLKLLEFSRDHFNELTRSHLDFYYKEVLRIKKKEPEYDQVHLLFELAKTATSELIPAGTLMDAGKDAQGRKRYYKTNDDLVINRAVVENISSLCLPPVLSGQKQKIIWSPVTRSADGQGEAFEDENASWCVFGSHSSHEAAIGFALASPVLLLTEGERSVVMTLNLSFDSPPATLPDNNAILNGTMVYFSGEKSWIGPLALSSSLSTDTSVTTGLATGSSGSYSLRLVVDIGTDAGAIVNYNNKALKENFNTLFPVVKVLFSSGAGIIETLKKATITASELKVTVRDFKSLRLENDQGPLNAGKPFMPFGPAPIVKSNFHIYCDEAEDKSMTSFSLNFDWLGLPSSFEDLYYAYREECLYPSGTLMYIKDQAAFTSAIEKMELEELGEVVKKNMKKTGDAELLGVVKQEMGYKYATSNQGQIVTSDTYFTVTLRGVIPGTGTFSDKSGEYLFVNEGSSSLSEKVAIESGSLSFNKGYLRLILEKDFMHQHFPFLYAMAMTGEGEGTIIPNSPYTPLVNSLTLNYSASETSAIQHFHLLPSGQAEIGEDIRKGLDFLTQSQKKNWLMPQLNNEGECYLGIANLDKLQSISLLFQVAEGSEDPLASRQNLEWSVLCNNYWKALTESEMISDTTNQLLTSGIVRLTIPKEASDENTLLGEGKIWLRITIPQQMRAVCKVIAVHTQAVTATFDNQENDLAHLASGLEAQTIKKLKERKAAVKKVDQPYSSFGGRPAESGLAYYTRVSERLRHKQRAITIWDFEHLVLEEFPEIYKVKCLNHTSESSELSPGNITVVVIPDLSNDNASDKLQPRVSLDKLSRIKDYLAEHCTFFVTQHISVVNPNYEQIELSFEVSFYTGYDYGYYLNKLEEDIIAYLSPWASDSNADIVFGGKIHKSIVIRFLEEVEYVDYIANFKMYQYIDGVKTLTDEAQARSSRSILVSAPSHDIKPVTTACQ